jgi:putative SOS response-associated peptidase YedK
VSEIKTRLLDPATSAHPELPADLERRADRFASGGPLRREGRRPQPGPIALGLGAVLGQGPQIGFANINAKAEGIESKPAFRDAFQRRRRLVPVVYEWKKTADFHS